MQLMAENQPLNVFFFFFTLTAQNLFMTFFVGCLFWLSVQHEAPSSVITTRMTSRGAS